jgi:hypothetical protein
MMHLRSPALSTRFACCRSAMASLAILLGCQLTTAAAGTPPVVTFDVPFTVSCRSLRLDSSEKASVEAGLRRMMDTVTWRRKGPAWNDPEKELIEVVIPISARMQAGTERDLKQCLYTLVDAVEPATLSVEDWLPRTEMKTEYAKPIQFSKEGSANIGINLSAKYVVSATGQAGGQLKSGTTYEMLPPQEIVLASGTVQHGHGIFFKLKPSTQTTLEGVKSFSAILCVPRGWRGGSLKLECEAVGLDRALLPHLDREVMSGRAVFWVGLHLAGDAEAERLADNVARCQQELLDSFGQHRHEAGSAWYRALSLPELGKRLPLLDRLGTSGEALTEAGVLGDLQDRAPTPAKIEQIPPSIREKLWALQRAVDALQALSLGRPPVGEQTDRRQRRAVSPDQSPNAAVDADSASKRGSARGGIRTVTAFAELKDSDSQSLPTKPERQNKLPEASRDEPGKVNPRVAPVLQDRAEGNDKNGRAAPNLEPAFPRVTPVSPTAPRPPAARASAKPPECAADGAKKIVAEPFAVERSDRGQPHRDPSTRVWYLLASIWGALFTYIVAPLVVDFVSKRTRNAR